MYPVDLKVYSIANVFLHGGQAQASHSDTPVGGEQEMALQMGCH